jgi:hypothetical protein
MNTEQIVQDEVAKGLDALFGDLAGAAPLTRHRVEHVLRIVAHHAATTGGDQALLELMTTEQMAGELGVSERRVRAIAKRRGVGWQISRGVWLFRPADVERLRPGDPWRPKAK